MLKCKDIMRDTYKKTRNKSNRDTDTLGREIINIY